MKSQAKRKRFVAEKNRRDKAWNAATDAMFLAASQLSRAVDLRLDAGCAGEEVTKSMVAIRKNMAQFEAVQRSEAKAWKALSPYVEKEERELEAAAEKADAVAREETP